MTELETGAMPPAQGSPLPIARLFDAALANDPAQATIFTTMRRYGYAGFGMRARRLRTSIKLNKRELRDTFAA